MTKGWNELFPEGRYIFYEGDDLTRFAKEIKKKFGFDVFQNGSFGFHCPPELLDAIYGSGEYPIGVIVEAHKARPIT
jgi:hypothetical protein